MNLTIFKLEQQLLLLLLVSPVIFLMLFPREAQAETGTELGDNDGDYSEPEDFYGTKPHPQKQDSYLEVMEKLRSYEGIMTQMKGVPEKLNELYAFFPLLQQLKKNWLEQERLKGEMMRSPHAKLYTGTNLTGNFENYDFHSASVGKGCHRLQSYSEKIKSIDTDGTCVRLYSDCACAHWSQAFYPGMNVNSMDSKLGGICSIGPCVSNELEDAEVKVSGSELTVKKGKNGVPDLIGDYWTWKNKTFLSSSLTNIRGYNLGYGNRLEGVYAHIYPKHLRSPEEAQQVRSAGLSFSSARFNLIEDREEVGFAIPLELGGVSDQLYNIFPQDKAAAVKYRDTFISASKEYLEKTPDNYVSLALRFFYESSTATKPTGIWYQFFPDAPTSGYFYN